MPFLLAIPPNSLNKQWAPYLRTLSGTMVGNRPVDVADVVTRITFDPTTQGTLNFQAMRFVSEEEMNAVVALQASEKTALLVGKNDKSFAGQLPAPQAAPAITAPVQPPASPQFAQQAFAQSPVAQPVAPQQQFIQPGMPGASPFGQAAPPAQPMFAQPGQTNVQPGQTNVQPLVPPSAVPQPAPQRQRVRRTRAEMEAQQGGQAQSQQEIIPPQQQAPMFQQQPTAPQPPTQQHGMIQNAPPPPADMASALAAALNLPTGG